VTGGGSMRRMDSNWPVFWLKADKLAVLAQHGQRGNALVQRHIVLLGDVQVGITFMPMFTCTKTKVRLQNGQVLRIVEVDVQHLAVAAPKLPPKSTNDALVGFGSRLESGGQVGLGRGRPAG